MKKAVKLTKANNTAMKKYDDFADSMLTTGPSGTDSAHGASPVSTVPAPTSSSGAKSAENPDKK